MVSSSKKRKTVGDDPSCEEEPVDTSKRALPASLPDLLEYLHLFKNYPYLLHPGNYESKCSSCHRRFTLSGLARLGIAGCSSCGYHNILEPAPSGYKFIRYNRCSHAELIEESKPPGSCSTCGELSSDSSVEQTFQRPQLKRVTEEKQAFLREMKRHPHRVVPDLFECRCVWEGCLKFFTPYNCDEGTAQCSNCFKHVPIEFGEPGYAWMFYNRCSHVHSFPVSRVPRNCPTCGIESTVRPSGIAAPKRKQQIELPNAPF